MLPCLHSGVMETKEHGYRDNAYTGTKNLAEQARDKVAESHDLNKEYTRKNFPHICEAILDYAADGKVRVSLLALMMAGPRYDGTWCKGTLISLLEKQRCCVGVLRGSSSLFVCWAEDPSKHLEAY